MMVKIYADIIVMRHYLEGAARYASEVTPVPIVNAGDRANHSTRRRRCSIFTLSTRRKERWKI